MRIIRASLILFTAVAVLVSSTPALAQQHVVDVSAMRQAITDQKTTRAADQAAVQTVLERQATRDLAKRLGLDLRGADQALATMSSTELAELAATARTVEVDLAGGAQVVVISVTTLLLILIIVLLIAN